jgi:hypothetical protein
MTGRHMPALQLTQAEYALQPIVKASGNLLFLLEAHNFTHIYQEVFPFGEPVNLNYVVVSNCNTSALLHEEYSE